VNNFTEWLLIQTLIWLPAGLFGYLIYYLQLTLDPDSELEDLYINWIKNNRDQLESKENREAARASE
jgi:hypothetical protein